MTHYTFNTIKGFPKWKNPFDKGNLLIQFVVEKMEPENYSIYCEKENLAKIGEILGQGDDDIIPQDCEECQVLDYDEDKHIIHQSDGMVLNISALSDIYFTILG